MIIGYLDLRASGVTYPVLIEETHIHLFASGLFPGLTHSTFLGGSKWPNVGNIDRLWGVGIICILGSLNRKPIPMGFGCRRTSLGGDLPLH